MNPAWQEFLSAQYAQFQEGVVQHFGDAQGELTKAKTCTVLCDLSQFGLLKVSGEDAPTFLQNLLSSDVREITPQRAQLSSFNSAKGRILATLLLWKTADDYFLQLPRSLATAMQKKLAMYVLRSKVKITDASDDLVCLGLAGKEARPLIDECFTSATQDVMAVSQHNHGSVIRLGENQFQIITTPQHAPILWKCLNDGARPTGSPVWDWLNIQAGTPVILPATQEQFVAQMANLDLIGGVNFKKGCYPGQEIVARMQYLGKLKQRMYLAHVESDTAPQAGDKLYSAEMEDQSCGMVANAAPAPEGGFDLLAVLQISSRENQTVHLGSPEGMALQFLPLPYAVPA